jgi:hypothetical protein
LSGILKKWDFWRLFLGGVRVFEVKTRFGRVIYRDWVKWAKQKRSKTFENIRKRSKSGVKCLKTFEEVRIFE